MPGRRGRASMPGSWGLAAIGKKSCRSSPPHDNLDILGRTGFYFSLVCRAGWAVPGRFAETFFLGRIPTLARAPMPGRRGRVAQRQAV